MFFESEVNYQASRSRSRFSRIARHMEDLGAKGKIALNCHSRCNKEQFGRATNHSADLLQRIATLKRLDGLINDRLGNFLCDKFATGLRANIMTSMWLHNPKTGCETNETPCWETEIGCNWATEKICFLSNFTPHAFAFLYQNGAESLPET